MLDERGQRPFAIRSLLLEQEAAGITEDGVGARNHAKSLTQPRGDNPPLLQTSQLRIVVRRATLTLTLTLTLAVAVALALAVTQAGDQAQP